MESLARLLTIASGGDPDGDEGLNLLEARLWLTGLARLLQDEDLVIEIAKRIYAYNHPSPWEDAPQHIRNGVILDALRTLDAFRDLITEELNP